MIGERQVTEYCGIDPHATNSGIAVLDETDRMVMVRRAANTFTPHV
jgi:hypothetical protein